MYLLLLSNTYSLRILHHKVQCLQHFQQFKEINLPILEQPFFMPFFLPLVPVKNIDNKDNYHRCR